MAVSKAVRRARRVALVVPAALLGGAYISQYAFGMFPCEMCWWQRYAHFCALAFALMAWWRPHSAFVALSALAIAFSGIIGGFHAGVEYGWWEGITACATHAAGGGDPLAAIMNAPIVRCDVAPWSLAGISLAGWNFLISAASALAITILLCRGDKGPVR